MGLEQGNVTKVYQNEDKEITCTISEQTENGQRGDPVDLTTATEVMVLFPKADGSPIVKRLSLGDVTPVRAAAGIFKVRLTADDTALLKVGDGIPIEVRFVIAGFLTIVQMQGTLSVQPSLFPNVAT